MIQTLTDAPARDSARMDLDRNVIVEAGAGTGKTTLLIDRIVFLLLGRRSGGAALDVSRLVALTFTEKAAAEIKFRLVERLNEISALLQGLPGPAGAAARRCLEDLRGRFGRAPEEILALAQAALRDIERAQIGTIHSFCAHILRLYPLEAGVDPEFRVDARQEEFGRLFEDEWALWLDRELGVDAPQPRLWREVLGTASLEGLCELARELAGPRVSLEAAQRSPGAAGRLRELAEEAAGLGAGQPKPKGKILEYLAWMSERLESAAEALEGKGRAAAGKASPTAGVPAWPAAWDAAREPDYQRLAKLARRIDPGVEPVYRAAVGLLEPFIESLRAAYRRRGMVTFDGLLVGARDLVRGDMRARAELKARFGALLIDEFQDTDPIQVELLMFLAENRSGRARTWQEVEAEPGKLFIVGDPKQSIYRFRGADIAAVESFGGHLERGGALRVALQANFRSSAGIVDCVNRVFDAVMRPAEGLQPAYIPISAGAGSSGPPPEWLIAPSLEGGRPARAEENRAAEADWIARWIVSERGSHRLKDIALILRSTTALGAYIDALKRARIPYVVEGEKYFYGTQEVTDFVNLLRVIDDPEDRIALVGLLRSPAAALDDKELYRLVRADLLDYRKEPGSDWGDLSAFYGRLRRLHAAAGLEPLGELVALSLRETRLVEFASRAYSHQQTASNLLKLGRLAAEASDRGGTLKEFIDFAASSVRDLREEGESPLADEDYDAVRILTIHKAKGLEYPVVILPNLGGGTGGRGSREALRLGWSRPAVGLRLKGCSAANAAMALLEEEEDRRQRQEEVRVLYVAMTRPKERLFLLGGPARNGGSFADLLERSGGVLSRALGPRKAGDSPREQASRVLWRAPEPGAWAKRWEERAARARAARARVLFTSPTAPAPHGDRPVLARAGGTGGGIFLGRLCHEVLERWDFAAGGDLEGLIGRRAAGLEQEAPDEPWAEIRREARGILSGFLKSDAGRRLAQADILGREIPFLFPRGGAAARGTIDLLYRFGGRTVIADYKTDAADPSARERLAEKYRRQGEFYVEAVRRALGIEGVEFEVVFLRAP